MYLTPTIALTKQMTKQLQSHFHTQTDLIPPEDYRQRPSLPHLLCPSFIYLQIVLLALHFYWG